MTAYAEIMRPSISPAQSRAARAMLKVTQLEVSLLANISQEMLKVFERGDHAHRFSNNRMQRILRRYYESHGIMFYARHGVSFLGGDSETVTKSQIRLVNELRGVEVV